MTQYISIDSNLLRGRRLEFISLGCMPKVSGGPWNSSLLVWSRRTEVLITTSFVAERDGVWKPRMGAAGEKIRCLISSAVDVAGVQLSERLVSRL